MYFPSLNTEHLIEEKDMDYITWTDKLFILLSTELESLGLNSCNSQMMTRISGM